MEAYNFQDGFEHQVVQHFCKDKVFFHMFQKYLEPDLLSSESAKLAVSTAQAIFKDINDAPGSFDVVLNRANTYVNHGKVDLSAYCDLVMYAADGINTDGNVVARELAPTLKERARHLAIMKGIEKKMSRSSLEEVGRYISEIENIGEYVEGRAPLSLDDDSLFKALEKMSNMERQKTGVDELDMCISGGLPRGTLGVVIGRPAGGKSVALCQFASYAYATGKTVAHIVISEIPGEIGGARVLAPIIGMKISDITRDPNAARVAWAEYRKTRSVGGYNVFDFPSKTPVSVIREHVMSFYKKFKTKPDVVLFDYLGLTTSTKAPKTANGYTQGEFTTGELHDWAKEENIWIWTAAQSVRLKDRGRGSRSIIGLDDIADSYHIVRIADVVITINTVEVGDQGSGMFEGQFLVAKHRFGPSGQLTTMSPVQWDTGMLAPCSLFMHQSASGFGVSPSMLVN